MKYKAQLIHKAQHCGYRKKPSKKQVKSLLGLYEGVNKMVNKSKSQSTEQLKVNF